MNGCLCKEGKKESMSKHRILLADDNDLVRSLLAQLLESSKDVQVIGQAADGYAAVEMVKQCSPDAVIMDVRMPRMDGVEASRIIHSEFPSVRIIGLSILEMEDIDKDMLEAGAVACFSKNDSWDAIMAGIHHALSSGSPFRVVV
jgi:DNA-binding NarL/FixJ family response regulator